MGQGMQRYRAEKKQTLEDDDEMDIVGKDGYISVMICLGLYLVTVLHDSSAFDPYPPSDTDAA